MPAPAPLSDPWNSRLAHRWGRHRRAVRRVVLSRRRPLAALLAAAAVVAAVHELRPPPAQVVPVLTAARDLPAGTILAPEDLRTLDFAAGTAPGGLAAHAAGRVLAGPIRAGEPVTDLRLVGEPLASAYPGHAVMPVRLPDAGMAALLRVGDRIDLVAADPQGETARVVADGLTVVALPATDEVVTAAGIPGRLVVVATPVTSREAIAQAAVTGFLSFSYAR